MISSKTKTNIVDVGVEINKFLYSDFDYKSIVKKKNESNLKVSVGVPVKNEEDTLGKVLDSLALHKNNGLIDSFAVFDSSSNDSSGIIAAERNVDFIVDKEFADKLGLKYGVDWKQGKGFNLWASLKHFYDSDIITWVDADVELVPRFLYGIIGPLVMYKNIKFSKGTYKRDMGDSRVSAYTVDPVLGLLFPEAGKLSDPLCGFFGGRSDFLKKIPFSSGYSVEITTLVHALMNSEENEIAQINLGELANRKHSDKYLSAMGATITSAIFDLAVAYNKLEAKPKLSDIIVQRDCSNDDMNGTLLNNFKDIMLKPMIEYTK